MKVALGSRSHVKVRPDVKDRLVQFFSVVLGCGEPVSLPLPMLAEPILAFRFPAGGSISFEFAADAGDEHEIRRGAWLELQTDDVDTLCARVVEAGAERVTYVKPTFYFVAPGGQVFGIVSAPRIS